MPKTFEEFPTLRVLEHPLIQQKLSIARAASTSTRRFRELLNEIAALMTYEVSRHLPTEAIEVETPLEKTAGVRLSKPITLVPVLRAGIGMTEGILRLIPEARVGHVGLYRNEETLEPVAYYEKLPRDIAEGPVLLVDPMLATGGSATAAATMLKEAQCRDITFLCLVCVPEGVNRFHAEHPAVEIYSASLDRELNDVGYILPGLGDAGDRIFGTI